MPITDIDRLVFHHHTDDASLAPLIAPTVDIGANVTSTTVATVGIGFTFRFDGVPYTSASLSVHGFLRLAGSLTSSSNSNLFASSTSVALAAWYDALRTAPTGGYVQHETQGVAPWRRFVAEWYVATNGDASTTDCRWAKFQILLYESSDRVEYRYGALEVLGSPNNTSDASIGLKGDTSTTLDNFRDLAVDNRELGGSNTTTTTNLRAYVPGEWPDYRIVYEPNWPMVGFYVDEPQGQISGIQGPEVDYHWRVANNVNWLYCNHCPALVNFAPWAAEQIDSPLYVTPIKPSLDAGVNGSDEYEVWIEGHTEEPTTVGLGVAYATSPNPQPLGGAWSSLASVPASPVSEIVSWHFDLDITPTMQFLRWSFVGDLTTAMSIVVRPKPRTDFDPMGTFPSGFVPMAIGQVRQQGAAIHPEYQNRAWRNVALILLDRKQCLWSFGTSTDSDTDFGITSTDWTTRMLGKSPCAMLGWFNQNATAQLYAYDTGNTGKAVFGEDGGRNVSLAVEDNAAEYRLQEIDMPIISPQPIISLSADPSLVMRVAYAAVLWAPNLSAERYIRGVTPSPKSEYLTALASRIRIACLYSYSMTGLATLLRLNTSGFWRCSFIVPPATAYLRPKLMRHNGANKGQESEATQIVATSSGATSDDRIIIPSPHATGRDSYTPDGGELKTQAGATMWQPLPTDPMDRLMESPTLNSWTGSVRELVLVKYAVGITLIPIAGDPAAN